MVSFAELRSLPMAERLLLVEDLWDTIAVDQHSLLDHSAMINELRSRKTRLMADPASAILWDEAKQQIKLTRD
jgi:putative addiction module component (TIGR02574 family)